MGSMQFAGWMVASLFVPRLGDVYGRKWPVHISVIVAFFIYLGVLLSNSLNLNIAFFFFFGACCAGRYQICYVYLSELTPVKYRTLVGSATQFMDAFTFILIAVYYRFISKEWLPF